MPIFDRPNPPTLSESKAHRIRQKDGIWVFDVNLKTPEKSLKTKSSIRSVPVHPVLVSAGFLEYVEKMRRKGKKRLWPNLTHNERWGYRRRFANWFDGVNRSILTKNPKKVFHSFRHNFADVLRQDIVPLDVRESLLGHQQPQQANIVYAQPLNPERLLEDGIKKVIYDIDLSPIIHRSL